MKVWDWAGIKLATPESTVGVATNCTTGLRTLFVNEQDITKENRNVKFSVVVDAPITM